MGTSGRGALAGAVSRGGKTFLQLLMNQQAQKQQGKQSALKALMEMKDFDLREAGLSEDKRQFDAGTKLKTGELALDRILAADKNLQAVDLENLRSKNDLTAENARFGHQKELAGMEKDWGRAANKEDVINEFILSGLKQSVTPARSDMGGTLPPLFDREAFLKSLDELKAMMGPYSAEPKSKTGELDLDAIENALKKELERIGSGR